MKRGEPLQPAPTRKQLLAIAVVAALGAAISAGVLWWDSRPSKIDPDKVIVYKDPNCHCCSRWVKHLQEAGFTVEVEAEFNLDSRNQALGIPKPLAACHTALVQGYIIEGHVPVQDIQRLLAEKPKARGLAVPGMPVGSPGMEMGDRVDPYDVVLFDDQGHQQRFAHHGDAAPAATTVAH